MVNGRIQHPGRDVITIHALAFDLACEAGHAWVLTIEQIAADPASAETCPVCGLAAIGARISEQTRTLDRRGVVISFPRD